MHLGRQFGWLWAAYATSTFGTWLAFDAFPLVAILVLDAGPAQVALLAAAGLAVGAVVAVPLGPWVEFRPKRPVMIGTDLIRFCALMTVPLAFVGGWLTFTHLLVVAVVVAAADIAFRSASGAYLKALVPPEHLLVANGRFESTSWTATLLGPPAGGLLIGMFGPVTSVVANAVSYLLSALGIRTIGWHEDPPRRTVAPRPRDLFDGWRHLLGHAGLRGLFVNTLLVNALIMATAPLLAVLMLTDLGFAPWQYGLAFATPCVGGLVGSRLSRPLARRFGRRRVMRVAGTLRACWLLGLAFVGPGVGGIVLVILVELGLVTSVGVFNPLLATYRLEQTPSHLVSRTLSAWTVSSNATIAAMTAVWGLLAGFTGSRVAVAIAGVLILFTPLALFRPLPAEPVAARPEPVR